MKQFFTFFLAYLLTISQVFAGSPAIFSGSRTQTLSSAGLVLKDGTTIDNDGAIEYIKNSKAEVNANGWTEYITNGQSFTSANVNTTNDTITITAHGYSNNEPVWFTQYSTLPSPLSTMNPYYVIVVDANTIKVSTTPGGSPVDITSTGGATNYMQSAYPNAAKVIAGSNVGLTTMTRTTSSPLAGSGSFLFTATTSGSAGYGQAYKFAIDPAGAGQVHTISFDYSASGYTTCSTGDLTYAGDPSMTVWIVDVTNSALIKPLNIRPCASSGTFTSSFIATSSTSYYLVLNRNNMNDNITVKADNVSVKRLTQAFYGYGVPNNVFSAKVSNTGVVSDLNQTGWLSGNCAVTDTSLFSCPVSSGLANLTLTCNVSPVVGDVSANISVKIEYQSSSAIAVRTGFSTTSTSFSKYPYTFNITCTRAGTDFIQPTITAGNWDFDWRTCPSISGSWTSNTTYSCMYRRQGPDAEFDIAVQLTGAPNPVALVLNLPVTIDTSKMTLTGGFAPFKGIGSAVSNGTYYQTQVLFNSTTSVNVWSLSAVNTAGHDLNPVTQAIPSTFTNGDKVSVRFSVPVVGWTTTLNAQQLLNSVITQYSGVNNKIESEVHCFSSASITSQTGGISAIGNRSSNTCALTIANGTFSANPWKCGVTVKSTTVQSMGCTCSSSTSCTIAGPSADFDAYVSIEGPK